MALSFDWPDPETRGATTIPGAYARWAGVSIDRPIRVIQAWFHVFRNPAAADSGGPPIDQIHMWADDSTDPSYDAIRVAQAAKAESIDELIYEFAKQWLAKNRPELTDVEDI